MKATLYSSAGEKKSEISLPSLFDTPIRDDLASKYFEAEKFVLRQPYSHFDEAGKRHSASGTISHRRHKWKGAYGKGISRVPRKKMYRRGTQFFWIGAEVASARGGRTIHAPQGLYINRKINKKERVLAIQTGLAATANPTLIKKRYSSFTSVPSSAAVIESLPSKTKSLGPVLHKIFGQNTDKLFQVKSVRAGSGKGRARRYKSNAGLLIITAKDEKAKFAGLDIKTISNINMRDLYPLGRLTLFTQKSLEEIKNVA